MRVAGPGSKWGRRGERRYRICVLLLGAAYLCGAAAHAAPNASEEAIARGLELRRSTRDSEALEEFKRAYQLSPSPRALAQMAWAEQALGRWVDAEAHLREALNAKSDPWIRKVHGRIEDSLLAVGAHLGSLEVTGSPAGADVNVDGKKAGNLPLPGPIRVPAGDVVLEVRAENYRPISRTVDVRARVLARETVTLVATEAQPQTSAPLATASKANAEPAAVAATVVKPAPAVGAPPVDARASEPDSDRGTWRRPVKWIVAGAAVLMAGAGVTGLVLHEQKVSAFDGRLDPMTMTKRCSNSAGGVLGGDDCVTLAHDAERWRDVAIIGFVGAGVFAAGALILQLTDDGAPAGARSNATTMPDRGGLRLACQVDPFARGAACGVRF